MFFFQAEDGIRDTSVTGVQTCALPICEVVSPYGSGFTRVPSKSPAVFPKGIPPSRHSPRGGVPMRLLILATLVLSAYAATDSVAPGSLTTPKGLCPLRHTDVQVRIAGALARVTVTQEFHN